MIKSVNGKSLDESDSKFLSKQSVSHSKQMISDASLESHSKRQKTHGLNASKDDNKKRRKLNDMDILA